MTAQNKFNIEVGDAIYYDRSYAYCIVLDVSDGSVTYSLRSPTPSDLTNHFVSINSHAESDIVESIKSNRFRLIKGNTND